MSATLFIMSGLPGVGKSTLAKLLSKTYSAVYLRIDTVEQGLRDLCDFEVEGEGYRLSYRIAADNLKIGLNVIVDSCNPIMLTRKEWEDVAKANDCTSINIVITCSDIEQHKKRLQTRKSEIERLKSPTWQEVKNREYNPWTSNVIIIDTANKSIEESLIDLERGIKKHLSKAQ